MLTTKVTGARSLRHYRGSIGKVFNSLDVPVGCGASNVTRLPASMVQVDF